jgi:hypothetical protein
MIRRAALNVSVERIGPPSVQIYHSQAGSRTTVHLVTYQPDRRLGGPQIVEAPGSLSGIQLRLLDPRQPRTVRIEPEGVAATYHRHRQWLVTEVPSFAIHTAVVFEWA